jgi:hypothetical protein
LIGPSNVARPISVEVVPEPVVARTSLAEIAAATADPMRIPFHRRAFNVTGTIRREKMAFIAVPPVMALSSKDVREVVGETLEISWVFL